MSYLSDFEHSFMQHTLEIVRGYRGDYDATILINCLLGLLIVPKETAYKSIPTEPLSGLAKWGIDPRSIISAGKPTRANRNPETIRGLVHNLRNSVAHFRITPVPTTSEVHSFTFQDKNGLKATISVKELREFVERLAAYLDSK